MAFCHISTYHFGVSDSFQNSSFSDFFIKNNFMLIHITLEATCVMRNVIASLISKGVCLRDVFKRNVLRTTKIKYKVLTINVH